MTATVRPQERTRERQLRKYHVDSSGFVALRSPFLPFETLERWAGQPLREPSLSDPDVWRQNCQESRADLREWIELPFVREALFLASPSLDERLFVWREDPESEAGLRIEAALVKYLYRMCSRCTPFGLFAGNSVGTLAKDTRLELRAKERSRRHTRLDMEYLDAVVTQLASNVDVRDHLRFSTNSSVYEAAGTLRYAEARPSNGKRAYFLVDVEPHEHLRRILARAERGALLDEIAEAAVDPDVSFEDAREFVDQLVDAKLLVPDLGPVVTGPEAADDLLARLGAIDSAGEVRARLKTLRDGLALMDRSGPGVPPGEYRRLATLAEELAPVELSRFVQVDLVKPADTVTLAQDLVDEMVSAVEVLLDLFAHGHFDPLEDFRRAFEERYGDGFVPLVEALDEEIGVGFQTSHAPGADPSPLIAGLPFPAPTEEEKVGWGGRGRYLEWKLSAAIAAGAEELVLDPRELSRFHEVPGPKLADAFHIHATLLDSPPDDRTAARAVIEAAGGPSGARFLGRFCQGDRELGDRVDAHLRAEEALEPGVRYFEVVHLPEGRIGNILARPVLRDLELEYLGTSGAPREKTLRAQDLLVGLRRGRIVLWSRSLECEVRPRITSAHNVMWRSLGIYRFLSMLQSEGRVEGVMWSWGPLESQPRLPRVRLGRIVLTRAQWSVPKREIDELRKLSGHSAFVAVQEWRIRRGLPRWIGLVDQDNVLTVDLDHPLSVAAFLHELRSRETASLQEIFPGARTDVVSAPEGRFVNEVILPVVRRSGEPGGEAATSDAEAEKVDAEPRHPVRPIRCPVRSNVFAPGSEWLTVKLYAGPSVCDSILTDLIAPLAATATQAGIVHRWFFLRFGDPDWHLRVRFQGKPTGLTGELLPALHAATEAYLEDRRIHRVQIDTYVRETVRYGGAEAILAVEELFARDSESVAAFLSIASGDEGLDARWRFAFLGMDRLLVDLGFGLEARQALTSRLAEMFGDELQIDSELRKGLRDRYRIERASLECILEGVGEPADALGPAYDLLQLRSGGNAGPARELQGLRAADALAEPIEEIAGSLLHMHANRVLRSAQRAQEMVLYRFLEKTYTSKLARLRNLGGKR